uniref:four helix bundle protein n=1 Tax=uncultured Bacteroides sp. TaxID=162156 RepID=UPI0025DDD660|nr:four helix bundle protein [uncultured Bacteroides sp.]
MALTEELPIYRATYRLLNMLIRATQDFPRFYKYSLGTRMVDVCLEMSMLIYKANSSYEKVELIREFLSRFSMLQMLLRVSRLICYPPSLSIRIFNPPDAQIGKKQVYTYK